jgi:hypothetical protein
MANPRQVVTGRDLQVLLDIYKHRYLSVSQIQRLHFPSLQTAYRRLRTLVACDLIMGFTAPNIPEHMYYLSQKGSVQVAALLGVSPEALQWKEHSRAPKDYYFLRHFIKINDFRIALARCCPEAGIGLLGFIPEYLGNRTPGGGIAKYIKDFVCDVAANGEHLNHTPDAVFALEKNQKPALFFLEVDRGTEVVSDPEKGVMKACRFYLNYLVGGQYQRYSQDFGCEAFRGFRALFITSSEARLANMRQAVSAFGFEEKAKKFLWFATENQVLSATPFQTGWLSGDCRDSTRYKIG